MSLGRIQSMGLPKAMQYLRLAQPWGAAKQSRLSNLPVSQRLLHSSSSSKSMERPEPSVQVVDPALAAASRWQSGVSGAHSHRQHGKGRTGKANWLVDHLLAQWNVARPQSSDEVPAKAPSHLPLAWDDRANGMLHWSYHRAPHLTQRLGACGISDAVYKKYCQVQASLQVLWEARLFAAQKITVEQIKVKYADLLGVARCADVLAPVFGFKGVVPARMWRIFRTNDARIGAYLNVIEELNLDECIKHLKTKVDMHATQADFLRLLENAKTVPVPSSLAQPDYWPKFTFREPYPKLFSTGDGDSYEEHLDDFLQKAPALKKSLDAAGDDAGRQLRKRYGTVLLRVFLQAMMSPAARTGKGTSLQFRDLHAIPQQDLYALLIDKFATSDKEAGTFEADDLLDATQQERIDASYHLRKADWRSRMASRGKAKVEASLVPRPSARSASSAA